MTKEILFNSERLCFREIDLSDTDTIVEWRSDPNVFQFFKNPKKISKREHLNWFQNSYTKNASRLDLIAFDQKGNRIGVFGLVLDKDSAEINYIVAPDHRGKGYATEGIISIMLYAIQKHRISIFKAEIHAKNTASISLIQKLHFIRTSRKSCFERYELLVDKRLFFRADGNSKIGLGHIMRCIAIADAAKKKSLEPFFIISDDSCKNIIDSHHISSLVLNTQWNNTTHDIPTINRIVKEQRIASILFDSYQIESESLKELACPSLYFDDFNKNDIFANTIIRYTPCNSKLPLLNKKSIDYLSGLDYVPLKDDYIDCPPKDISADIKNIVVVAGGSNPNHISSKIAFFLANKLSANIIAVDNASFSSSPSLPNLKIIKPTNHIAKYYKEADLVISSGGITLYELCACGTPAISFLIAENQQNNIDFFRNENLIPYAGTDKDSALLDNILKLVNKMAPKQSRTSSSTRMQKIIDGNGANRIVEKMLRYNLSNNLLKKR